MKEAGSMGTAAVISPVVSITYNGKNKAPEGWTKILFKGGRFYVFK